MSTKIRRIVFLLTVGLTAAAIAQQLRRPSYERTWHGSIAGVPYDFRLPTFSRIKDAWWNPDDSRLFTPRAFGVGWDVNLPRLIEVIQAKSKRDGDDGV